jgi:DegV family protein with EDD domain
MLRIVADGTVDLPKEWIDDYDIQVIPFPIQFGSRTYLQGVDLSDEEFFRLVRLNGVVPKTSMPSLGQFLQFYSKVAQPGDTVLSLHVSSKMSGTYNGALTAARELTDRFHIVPFDSWCGSAGLGFMCKEARLLERAGASLQEILNRLDFIRKNISIILTLDNMEFARMSGRISYMKAALVSLLSIKPIIVLKDGLLDMGDRARTRKRSVERVLDLARQRVGEQVVNVAVVHCNDLEAARAMVEQVKTLFHTQEVILTDLSIAVAANLGPGTVGIVLYPVA